jgi:hypothetical protein
MPFLHDVETDSHASIRTIDPTIESACMLRSSVSVWRCNLVRGFKSPRRKRSHREHAKIRHQLFRSRYKMAESAALDQYPRRVLQRTVRFSCHPKSVQENCKFASHGYNCSTLRVLTSSRGELDSPPANQCSSTFANEDTSAGSRHRCGTSTYARRSNRRYTIWGSTECANVGLSRIRIPYVQRMATVSSSPRT